MKKVSREDVDLQDHGGPSDEKFGISIIFEKEKGRKIV